MGQDGPYFTVPEVTMTDGHGRVVHDLLARRGWWVESSEQVVWRRSLAAGEGSCRYHAQ